MILDDAKQAARASSVCVFAEVTRFTHGTCGHKMNVGDLVADYGGGGDAGLQS